jgi:hypothetical protein
MKNYFLFLTIFSLFSFCKPQRECLNGEPFVEVSFQDKTTGYSLDTNRMTKISARGIGSGTIITNLTTFNQIKFYPGGSSILLPLNIAVDSSMFIIQNGPLSDTIIFSYKRDYEFVKQNCEGKKGTYIVNSKDLKINYTSLDSLQIRNYHSYYNEEHYLYIFY